MRYQDSEDGGLVYRTTGRPRGIEVDLLLHEGLGYSHVCGRRGVEKGAQGRWAML